ncbi:MAG: hypothetical protein HZC48_10770 [Nitrospirae bacterium]|nr:hypothetical protein [Nitrospirota bacterium]
MKDITELAVQERRLFEMDVIPFRALITASNISVLKDQFVFKSIELAEDESKNLIGLTMQTGEIKNEGKVYPIETLIIDRRSITFRIYSNSSIAKMFYNLIAEKISNADPSNLFQKDKYLIKTMETSCAVALDFNHKDIFAKKINVFLNKKATKLCSSAINEAANITIAPRAVTFSVDYAITDKKLLDNKISITSKLLTLEPRIGTNLKSNRFFTSSPTDSTTHLNLLKEFEALFKQ